MCDHYGTPHHRPLAWGLHSVQVDGRAAKPNQVYHPFDHSANLRMLLLIVVQLPLFWEGS